uniref:Uncharacterized protein LOC104214455 n=1 Tax=Nicotiana sylvestris TaxID=4096 RepID=A0A1U7VJ96_NICSY|nr:PREDICTED: uncharacterized protein LOC104214455 [Nicotiana sylvestris]
MVEIESARRADICAKIFLKMLEKYRCYRNKCREIHEQLKANPGARSLGEELEKSSCKEEELELGKGVAAECEYLQGKLRSMQSEMDQNLISVEAMSAEWMGKLAELERKVAVLENIESSWSSASARVAALENTICVLQSEQESERATATLREVRLEERIGDIDQEASTLWYRIAALEAEKEQLLAQVESSSTAVLRHLHELWVHVESQRDIYKSLWEAGNVTEAAYEVERARERETRVNSGYDFATPEADKGANDDEGFPGDGGDGIE